MPSNGTILGHMIVAASSSLLFSLYSFWATVFWGEYASAGFMLIPAFYLGRGAVRSWRMLFGR